MKPSTFPADVLARLETCVAMLSTAAADGSEPPRRLIRAALWSLAHSRHLSALRRAELEPGALAELADLDPEALALVLSSEEGRTALEADLAARDEQRERRS